MWRELRKHAGLSEVPMSYTHDVCNSLVETLHRITTQNRHQLAGNAANLDFWICEVRHALSVIDGYRHRFERLKAAQTEYIQKHRPVEFGVEPYDPYPVPMQPPSRGIKDQELKELRTTLRETAHGFLKRCHKERLIDAPTFRNAAEELGISVNPSDLHTTGDL